MRVRIATRKSPLALAQTHWVAERLGALDATVSTEILEMSTVADQRLDVTLAAIGGKGLFVSELERALLEGRADLAVHSLKDVPAVMAEGLTLACVPEREDPRDALVTNDGAALDDLEAGAIVGTSSLRRTLQLRAHRNDLAYQPVRGSVGTRLDKLTRGECRALVLAMAGLKRLGLLERPHVALDETTSVPAVGQGALALQARSNDEPLLALLAQLEDAPSRACAEAERAFLRGLGGDCHTPLAGHARIEDGRVRFDGLVGSLDGSRVLRTGVERYLREAGSDALRTELVALGREAAERLLAEGAEALIREAAEEAAKADPRVR